MNWGSNSTHLQYWNGNCRYYYIPVLAAKSGVGEKCGLDIDACLVIIKSLQRATSDFCSISSRTFTSKHPHQCNCCDNGRNNEDDYKFNRVFASKCCLDPISECRTYRPTQNICINPSVSMRSLASHPQDQPLKEA